MLWHSTTLPVIKVNIIFIMRQKKGSLRRWAWWTLWTRMDEMDWHGRHKKPGQRLCANPVDLNNPIV